MRRFAFLAVMALGCSNNALPTENNASGGTSGGTTGAGTNGSTTAGTNGSTTAGTNGTTGGTTGTTTGGTTGGPAGSPCKSACDCMAGLACFQNMCVQSPMGMLYCCDDAASCPSGQFCQSAAGQFSTCGGGMTTGMGGGCKTACDCPAGEACFMGGCVAPPQGKLYCCDTNCPTSGNNNFCQASDGSFMMCGGGGTSGTSGGTGGTTGTMMMCQQVMCMSDADCTMAGCNNGCRMSRRTCR
jgi:hypothetical protein